MSLRIGFDSPTPEHALCCHQLSWIIGYDVKFAAAIALVVNDAHCKNGSNGTAATNRNCVANYHAALLCIA